MPPAPQDGAPLVLTRPRPAVWVRVLACLGLAVIVGMWVLLLTQGTPPSSLPLIAPTVLGAVGVASWVRPPRIELHGTGLVVVPLLRTRRVRYGDISAVKGDAGRVEWSTRLHLELADGRRLVLPHVSTSLVETHALISRRAGLATTPPGGRPQAPRQQH